MAAELKEENEKEIVSRFVKNPFNILLIYQFIKNAVIETNLDNRVIHTKNYITVATKHSKPNRSESQELRNSNYLIEYNPNDITIVGGSALNLYDILLKKIKERKEMKQLKSYINRETTDIDIVLWPRISTIQPFVDITDMEDYIITSKSLAIKSFISVLIEKLNKEFQAYPLSNERIQFKK